jgi:L-proline---[L-prolyl-carrier protein] ligase
MPLSLAHVLETAADCYGTRPAIRAPGGETRTYRDVADAAARVSEALRRAGVSRGDRVGLLLPKSGESVASVWGVLACGAVYVPIDPGAPPQRAAYIAANCALSAVLASSELAPQIHAIAAEVSPVQILKVHGGAAADFQGQSLDVWAGAVDAPGGERPNARDLAYILYTSGSTGVPKGVMVSHGAATSFPEWAFHRVGVRCDDRVASLAPLHFDLSTFDLFTTAMAGACLVILDDETVRFPMALAQAIEAERITLCYSVPSALRSMMRKGQLARRDLPALRTVLFAGEVYPPEELRALQQALPHVRLVNLYGPTETNVCTWWEVPPPGMWTEPLIGIDCETCDSVVVDEQMIPVPPGTPGELLVRGATVMEGYWGDPDRTARAFVANLRQPHLTDRYYRTGDIVVKRADGAYAFHGRRDHMVKVRGYRVELGEVEAALQGASGIAAAIVVPRTAGGNTDLVAFLVAEHLSAADLLTAAVTRRLAERLPKYMIPTEFRWVDQLPLTSTGKVDRQALAAALDVSPHVESTPDDR